jgi:hypothetical protein
MRCVDRIYMYRKLWEVGAGIGTMIERMLSRKLLNYAVYTAIDARKQNKDLARSGLREWSSNHNLRFEETSSDQWCMAGKRKYIEINFKDEDIFDFATHEHGRYDLMIANAFLDLVDIPTTLTLLLNLLDNKGGLIYFTINYDGATILEPVIDSEFDEQILELYHCTMNNRIVNDKRSGDSQSGRHLVSYLKNAGVQILASGASDWVIIAGPDGYSQDEAYFMHHIVHTIHQALIGSLVDLKKFEEWIAKRHCQIEREDLIYIAHQLDFLGAIVD